MSSAWTRGVGTEVVSGMSIDQQLIAAGLDWQVCVGDIRYGSQFEHESSFRKAIYRSDSGLLLDTSGDRWSPFQNRVIVESLHRFCNHAGLQLNYLGALQEGRVILGAANLPGTVDVGNVGDIVSARLLLTNYHMSGKGLQIKLYLERLVCTNGMTKPIAFGGTSINHIGAFNSAKVERLLEAAQSNFTLFGADAEKLARTSISEKEARLMLIKEFGDPSKALDEQPKQVKICLQLFNGKAKGSDFLSAYQTAWGLLNSVTEYYNHYSQVRGGSATHLNSLLLGSKGAKQNSFAQKLLAIC